MNRLLTSLSLSAVLSIASINLDAAEVEVSGYFSAIGTYSDNEDNIDYYNNTATKNVRFDGPDSRIGIQFSAAINQRMSFTTVLEATGGEQQDRQFGFEATWAYAGYQITPDLELRMGKVKLPSFMISDYAEVGYAYPWIRPPEEVYSTNPMKALNGLDMLYSTNLGSWNFLFQLYGGSNNNTAVTHAPAADYSSTPAQKDETFTFVTRNMLGFNTSIGNDIFNFRVGYFETKVDVPSMGLEDLMGSFGGVGFNLDWQNIVIYSEFIRRETVEEMEMAFPDQDAHYTTLGYRIGNFLPHITYARIDKGKDDSIFALKQESIKTGLRYDFEENAALKFEVNYVKTDRDPGDFTTGDYGYGLFESPTEKATIYSLGVDVIF